MHVNSRLDLAFVFTGRGAGHEALQALCDGRVNLAAEFEGRGIFERLFGPVVNINKKPELFSFLFDDIEFLTTCEVREIGSPKLVEVSVGNVELPAIH
jgi:hypothetical protein